MLLRRSIFSIFHNHLVDYPTPSNLTYIWGLGSLAGMCLVSQILSGIFLAMHYTPHIDLAFSSVEHIMRDVNYGWFMRYLHANGASFFFLIVYVHMGRSLYYGLYYYARKWLWFSGVIIFFLMMATAFMGYVLPWGQMSFWGATVITNLFTAIPGIGTPLAYWLWGGFSVGNATLNRFFSFHYLLPFAIVGMVILHLMLLHSQGSVNPLGIVKTGDKLSFYPYFYVKDYFGFILLSIGAMFILVYYPDALGHPDNYIEANALVTPAHIVPEWYFLPFYAILRAVPNKIGGVVLMGLSIAVLFILPFYQARYKTLYVTGRYSHQVFFWFFALLFILLGFLGGQPIAYPYTMISQILTFFYFFYFFVLLALEMVANYVIYETSAEFSKINRRLYRVEQMIRHRTLAALFIAFIIFLMVNPRRVFIKLLAVRGIWASTTSTKLSADWSGFLFVPSPAITDVLAQMRFPRRSVNNAKMSFLMYFTYACGMWKTKYTTLQRIRASRCALITENTLLDYVRDRNQHPYHLVTASPWPFVVSVSLSGVTIGFALYFHRIIDGFLTMNMGVLSLILVMAFWFRDIVREGTFHGDHTMLVQRGLKIGMILFIISEVCFFVAFFWGFFHSSLAPAIQIGGIWPPKGIQTFNPWEVPLINTIILLTSGVTVTWAHHAAASRNVYFISVARLLNSYRMRRLFYVFGHDRYGRLPRRVWRWLYTKTHLVWRSTRTMFWLRQMLSTSRFESRVNTIVNKLNTHLVGAAFQTGFLAQWRPYAVLYYSYIKRSRHALQLGLLLTVSLGLLFTMIQFYEYKHAAFSISDSIYGATFFMTTGFHGLHVIIGTLLLIGCVLRNFSYHFTNSHHVGLETSIWYWHFVDVVWLGLYISIYHWGNNLVS